jgi:LacI family transcriptional regulator
MCSHCNYFNPGVIPTLSKITIYEIARQAGVSVSTVSRVANNKPNVNSETRKRVLAILEKNNYNPNEAARGLVTKSSRIIGILLTDIRTTHHTEGIYYIQQELQEQGYSFLIMNTGREDAEKARYIKLLSQRCVEGAILVGSTFQSEMVKQAIATYMPNIPVFLANGYIDLPNCYGVISDEQDGVINCMHYVSQLGKKRPVFLVDYLTPSNQKKIDGFLEGCSKYFTKCASPVFIESGTDFSSYYETTIKLLADNPEIDAIIASEDIIAAGALKALHDEKIAVPEQVAVIGINNSFLAEMTSPPLTSLDNMLLGLSITIAHNLSAVLQGRQVMKKMMIYSKLVTREST